jgi:hypothetical protein
MSIYNGIPLFNLIKLGCRGVGTLEINHRCATRDCVGCLPKGCNFFLYSVLTFLLDLLLHPFSIRFFLSVWAELLLLPFTVLVALGLFQIDRCFLCACLSVRISMHTELPVVKFPTTCKAHNDPPCTGGYVLFCSEPGATMEGGLHSILSFHLVLKPPVHGSQVEHHLTPKIP